MNAFQRAAQSTISKIRDGVRSNLDVVFKRAKPEEKAAFVERENQKIAAVQQRAESIKDDAAHRYDLRLRAYRDARDAAAVALDEATQANAGPHRRAELARALDIAEAQLQEFLAPKLKEIDAAVAKVQAKLKAEEAQAVAIAKMPSAEVRAKAAADRKLAIAKAKAKAEREYEIAVYRRW